MSVAPVRRPARSLLAIARQAVLLLTLLVAATQALAGVVSLAWDPVVDSRVAGYMVHYGTASGSYATKVDVGNTTTASLGNLVDGTTYYFAVTAYDGARVESGFSNEVSTVPGGGAPVANFSASTTTGAAPLSLNFINSSTGTIDTYSWTFGDGTFSTAQNPTHLYSNPGVYSVTLVVSGPGGSNTLTKSNYVTVTSGAPVASFSATPTNGVAPLAVNFTSTSTGTISTYAWSFGDGTSSSAQSPAKSYTNPGTYTVSLTVTGPGGSNTQTRTNYITVGSSTAPVASFAGTPTIGTAPLSVSFTSASTGTISTYAWNFGDGTTSTVANPTKVYSTAGVYTVSLTVTGPGGSNTQTKTGYVTVNATAAPVASFTGTPTSGTVPLTVNFASSSTGTISAYAWNFGDGTSSSEANPVKVYSNTGVFTVSLTVTGPGGSNTQTRSNYIGVSATGTTTSGSLTGSLTTASGTVDLTSVGTTDWVQWPTNARKATGGGQIANYAIVGSGTAGNYSGDPRTVKWSDGSPLASGQTNEGVSVTGLGRGFQVTAPADTTTRTLVVYVGSANAAGRLTARLSDGSASDYVNSGIRKISRSWNGVYTLTYRAASAGQRLTVQWIQTSGKGGSSTVRLQGAALKGTAAP